MLEFVITVVVVPPPSLELVLIVVVPLPEVDTLVPLPSLMMVVELFKPVAETLPLLATAVQFVLEVVEVVDDVTLLELSISCSQGNRAEFSRSCSPFGPSTHV